MKIRIYHSDDCEEIIELFYNTVHSINAKDYTKEQLNVWATKTIDPIVWDKSLAEHYAVVAEINGSIVGFGDIDNTGYLDRLYVHRNYQGKRIGTAIITELENYALKKNLNFISTHASITAKPFFEKFGYYVVKEQVVERSGQRLINFVMQNNLVKWEIYLYSVQGGYKHNLNYDEGLSYHYLEPSGEVECNKRL